MSESKDREKEDILNENVSMWISALEELSQELNLPILDSVQTDRTKWEDVTCLCFEKFTVEVHTSLTGIRMRCTLDPTVRTSFPRKPKVREKDKNKITNFLKSCNTSLPRIDNI